MQISSSAVTILKIDFEVGSFLRIEYRIEWVMLNNHMIDFWWCMTGTV